MAYNTAATTQRERTGGSGSDWVYFNISFPVSNHESFILHTSLQKWTFNPFHPTWTDVELCGKNVWAFIRSHKCSTTLNQPFKEEVAWSVPNLWTKSIVNNRGKQLNSFSWLLNQQRWLVLSHCRLLDVLVSVGSSRRAGSLFVDESRGLSDCSTYQCCVKCVSVIG